MRKVLSWFKMKYWTALVWAFIDEDLILPNSTLVLMSKRTGKTTIINLDHNCKVIV